MLHLGKRIGISHKFDRPDRQYLAYGKTFHPREPDDENSDIQIPPAVALRKDCPVRVPSPGLSEAEAHQEVMLADSRIAGIPDENFIDRLRRRDLTQQEVLARFAGLLHETRQCGGQIVRLGKILTHEILEFVERDPDLPSGLQLEAALRVLGELCPFLGPLVGPILTEVEVQGFGGVFAGTETPRTVERQARVFFKRFGEILNLTKDMLTVPGSSNLVEVSFDDPAPFELDLSENPFDLDDLSSVSPTTVATVKFLIKMAWAEGRFSDQERRAIARILEETGESLSQSQFERLVSEASRESLETILRAVEHQPTSFKERLLLTALLVTAADGKVEVVEKKLLAQALPFLSISRERYTEIAKGALAIIRAAKSPVPSQAIPVRREEARIGQGAAPAEIPTQGRVMPVPESPRQLEASARDDPADAARSRSEARLMVSGPASSQPPESARETGLSARPPVASPVQSQKPPEKRRIWRCPACRKPQFQEFEECPQCGVIVSKYLERRGAGDQSLQPPEFVELEPDISKEEQAAPARQNWQPAERDVPRKCPGCDFTLPGDAKFCPSCGTRVTQ